MELTIYLYLFTGCDNSPHIKSHVVLDVDEIQHIIDEIINDECLPFKCIQYVNALDNVELVIEHINDKFIRIVIYDSSYNKGLTKTILGFMNLIRKYIVFKNIEDLTFKK